jgi:hypothetical protein
MHASSLEGINKKGEPHHSLLLKGDSMETFQQVMYWFFAALLAAALVIGALFIKKRKSED